MLGTIGEIRGFAGNFAPRSWAFCSGQLLSIAQNSALFSILGTTYGGDGRTTFALPDLRGRVPISAGTGPGLSTRKLGQRSGVEDVYLNTLQMPSHTHTAVFEQKSGDVKIVAVDDTATLDSPEESYLAITEVGGANAIYSDATPDTHLGAGSQAIVTGSVLNATTGASQSHTNVQPYLTIYWIICMFGTFPSRS
jgi:microcystin-dependent protein